MTVYNTTFIDNTSGFLELVQGINDNTGSWFFGSLLMFTFLTLVIVFRRSGNQDAFLGASFITTVLAGLLFGASLLTAWQLVFPIVALVVSLILKVWGEG